MKKIIHLIAISMVLLSSLWCATTVHAYPPTPAGFEFRVTNENSCIDSGWKGSKAAACSAFVAATDGCWHGNPTAGGGAVSGDQCTYSYQYTNGSSGNGAFTFQSRSVGERCEGGGVLQGGQCVCQAPLVENAAHNGCESPTNACTAKAGKVGITNVTVGYSRTPDANDLSMVGSVNKVPADGKMCDGGCVVDLGQGQTAWQSQTPTAQGLYRWSIDFASVPTGTTCTPGAADAPANKTTPSPTCPGFVGEINGVKGCYGTAANPVNTVQADRPPSSRQTGNPSAGEKPSSGEGSGSTGAGRTPSSGDGGNAGGPSSSVGQPVGDGTTPKPADGTEQQACGAPGQPKCGIDETGTPNGTGALKQDDFKTELQKREDALSTVTSSSGKDTSWGVMPQWTQGGGTCSPWHIFTMPDSLGARSVDLDLCVVKPYADGVSNFIWCCLAFMGITSMVFATMTSKAN